MMASYAYEVNVHHYIYSNKVSSPEKNVFLYAGWAPTQYDVLEFQLEAISAQAVIYKGRGKGRHPVPVNGIIDFILDGKSIMNLTVHAAMAGRMQLPHPLHLTRNSSVTITIRFPGKSRADRHAAIALHGRRVMVAPEVTYTLGKPHKSGWIKIFEGGEAVTAAPNRLMAEELVKALRYRRISLQSKLAGRVAFEKMLAEENDNYADEDADA